MGKLGRDKARVEKSAQVATATWNYSWYDCFKFNSYDGLGCINNTFLSPHSLPPTIATSPEAEAMMPPFLQTPKHTQTEEREIVAACLIRYPLSLSLSLSLLLLVFSTKGAIVLYMG
ncbi:hypothetical protein L6452_02030 [Arctium lappa]|uniref:Uncharacterized protein n=1 Tax=Arctium lappa TaxID=4217 RepID=A0ACB9FIA1_ARCLA|nr:hypothetical protein L6452_02030 [Arctium lappa]